MSNRRKFLNNFAPGISGIPFISIPEFLPGNQEGQPAIVKQSQDCEIFFVRENTPITFNISRTTDHVPVISLLTEELLPGSTIPAHKHLNNDEYFFFITGKGSMIVDENSFPFSAGTTAFVPKATWHEIKNTGDDKVILCFGYSPAGFEDFFREVGTPKGQEFTPKPKEEFDAIAKKYGMVFK